MPLYTFTAIFPHKKKKEKGLLQALSLHQAHQKLLQQPLTILSVTPLEKREKIALSPAEKLTLIREIERLLRSSLPLYDTLLALAEKYQKEKLEPLLLDLLDQVESGKTLSFALQRHPHIFDPLCIAMVTNGEKSATLPQALGEMATLLLKGKEMRQQIIGALLYPAILTTFCIGVLSSLLFFVIPSLQELFEGKELHLFTTIVFHASTLAIHLKPLWLALLLGATVFFGYLFFFPSGKLVRKKLGSRLPFCSTLLTKIALARFCRAMATLLDGGIPILTALQEAKPTLQHPPLEQIIAKAIQAIERGAPLHEPFQNTPLVPPLLPRMLAIGKESGKLPFMMRQIAQIYEEDLAEWLSYFAKFAQPILLLVLGGIIGFVLLAVLLPLTDVSAFL